MAWGHACDDVDATGGEQDFGDAAGVAAQGHALQAAGLLQAGRACEEARGRSRCMASRLLYPALLPRQPLLPHSHAHVDGHKAKLQPMRLDKIAVSPHASQSCLTSTQSLRQHEDLSSRPDNNLKASNMHKLDVFVRKTSPCITRITHWHQGTKGQQNGMYCKTCHFHESIRMKGSLVKQGCEAALFEFPNRTFREGGGHLEEAGQANRHKTAEHLCAQNRGGRLAQTRAHTHLEGLQQELDLLIPRHHQEPDQ